MNERANYMTIPGLKNKPLLQPNWRKDVIIQIICDYFKVDVKELFGRGRSRREVEPRQVAMLMLKRHTHLNKSEIGLMFGRDHTSVIHSLRTVDDLLSTDPEYRENISTVEGIILS